MQETTLEMSPSEALNQLKLEFFEWCGLLSIDEIVSNANLIRVIERLERMLLAAGGE
ncbi:hypothetical protein WDW86_05415 [Bdellovibrionota bacterium FG-2]